VNPSGCQAVEKEASEEAISGREQIGRTKKMELELRAISIESKNSRDSLYDLKLEYTIRNRKVGLETRRRGETSHLDLS